MLECISKQLESWARCAPSGNRACSSLQPWCLLVFQLTTTWSPGVRLCCRRCGNAALGTRAGPPAVQALREKKGREKRWSWLQKGFPHHLSNTMQLQRCAGAWTHLKSSCVCVFFKPSLDFQQGQIAPGTHRSAHQKSITQYQHMAWLTNFLFCTKT